MKSTVRMGLIFVALMVASAAWVGLAINAAGARPADSASIYKKSCASCHGNDGRAKTLKAKFNGAKDLTRSAWQDNVSDSHIFNVISNGRPKMPAFGDKLSAAQIDGLVAFVRSLRR